MQKLLIVLVVVLSLPIIANAGWLSDKLKETSEDMTGTLIDDASDATYQKTKESTREVFEEDTEEDTSHQQEMDDPPPPWAERDAATKKKKSRSNSAMRTDLHFSADTVMTDPESSPTPMQGKMFVDGARMRFDMSTPEGGMSTIVTGNGPDDKIYQVIHGQKMYMTTTIRDADEDLWSVFSIPENPCEDYRNAKKQGSKTLIGRKATLWECNDPEEDDLAESMSIWIDQKLQIPIQSVMSDGNKYEVTSLSESTPPDNVFTVPKGYRALSY